MEGNIHDTRRKSSVQLNLSSLNGVVNTSSMAKPSTSSSSTSTTPPSLLKAREKYNQLTGFIDNISVKLNTLYGFNEREFLSTYRVHTLDLQSEIKYLKEKVKAAEDILNDDTTVASLEREANWFCEEVERLQDQLESMGRDYEALSVRTEVLADQRNYLTEQLKSVLKKNKFYELELQASANKLANSSESKSTGDFNQYNRSPGLLQSESLPAIFPTKQPKSKRKIRRKQSISKYITDDIDSMDYILNDVLVRNQSAPHPSSPFKSTKRVDAWANYDKYLASRSRAEMALEDSIRKTLDEEILPRKYPSRPSTRVEALAMRRAGIVGLGLEEFTDTDKLSTIIQFLSNDDILQEVIGQLVSIHNIQPDAQHPDDEPKNTQ